MTGRTNRAVIFVSHYGWARSRLIQHSSPRILPQTGSGTCVSHDRGKS
jgi:hypothetical protein